MTGTAQLISPGLPYPGIRGILKMGEDADMMIAVCDDELMTRRELSARIARYMDRRRSRSYDIREFPDGRSLLESDRGFDLIFLDIQMEQPDGMETARRLRQEGDHGLLIFVTVLREYVFDAFEVQAHDYLVKPLEEGRFERTMDRAMGILEKRVDKSLLIQRKGSSQVIPLSRILYCEVLGRKIYIHQRDGRIIDYYEKLADLEKRVDKRFFRCHRSYLVNLDFVQGCGEGQVLLPQEERIPVSRLRESDLAQALLRHMKERDR